MAYDPLTTGRFKELKPEFSEVPDAQVSNYLDMGSRFVDPSWTEGDYHTAWAAITCHLMTLDGLGTSTEAEIASAGGPKLSSLKSGTLSLTFAAGEKTGDEFGDWLGTTPCGKFYALLLRMNRGGPRLLSGSGLGVSGYAKDWPRSN